LIVQTELDFKSVTFHYSETNYINSIILNFILYYKIQGTSTIQKFDL